MANCPATYHFEVRVNWDKLLAIDEKNESFKAQLFFEAVLTHPREVERDDEKALMTVFERATVENSLAPPEKPPKLNKNEKMDENKETYTEWKFSWLLFGDFDQALDMRDFPLDSQDLTVMLRFGWPCREDKVQVRFVHGGKSKVALHAYCLTNTWTEPEVVDVKCGFTKTSKKHDDQEVGCDQVPDQFPLIQIRCRVGRLPTFYVSNVIIPVVLPVVLASACSEAISDDASFSLLLTAVAYKYLVTDMVPKGSHNTLLDMYIAGCWTFLLLIVLQSLFFKTHHPKLVIAFRVLFLLFNLAFALITWNIYRKRENFQSAQKEKRRKLLEKESDSSSEEDGYSQDDSDFDPEDPLQRGMPWKEVNQEAEMLLAKHKVKKQSDRSQSSDYFNNNSPVFSSNHNR